MPEERCRDCRYFQEIATGPVIGNCRRYPPTIIQDDDGETAMFPSSVYPVMVGEGWCGEFVQRKPVTLKDLAEGRSG